MIYHHHQFKRIFNDERIEAFLQNLLGNDWKTIETQQYTNEAYDNFMVTFCAIYDILLAVKKVKRKIKDLKSP